MRLLKLFVNEFKIIFVSKIKNLDSPPERVELSARQIKILNHKLYEKRLREIEKGIRKATLFNPKSDFGELKSTAKLKKKFKF